MSIAGAASLGLARWAALLGRDLQRAARHAGGPQSLWEADRERLRALLSIDPQRATELVQLRDRLDLAGERASLTAAGIEHQRRGGNDWPTGLAALPDPPFGLFAAASDPGCVWRGLRERPVIAIVGSRRADAAGRAFATDLAAGLADRGAVVVSGLAHGIDAAAHEGALSVDGLTVAVLGCGVDVVYPRRQRNLSARIRERGMLLSEYWPGTPPAPWRFPARNRIVAGLADAVAVVTAGRRSGALITADFALDAGRPVLAVPGWPTVADSQGCNALLRAGAGLLEGVDDIVAEVDHPGWREDTQRVGAIPDGLAAAVLAALARRAQTADEVGQGLDIGAAAIAGALALLEVDGLAIRGAGGRYAITPAGAATERAGPVPASVGDGASDG